MNWKVSGMAPPVADPEGDTIPGVPWPHSLKKKKKTKQDD